MGEPGTGGGEIKDPRKCFIDEVANKCFITDLANRKILVWSLEGKYLTEFGKDIMGTMIGNK